MALTDSTADAVDAFVTDLLATEDDALRRALRAGDEAGMPPIQVSAPHGMLLQLLARAMGARRILEIGALAGYSAIWLARALPEGGRLVTLELEPRHAEVARDNLRAAGLADRVEVVVGPATVSLRKMTETNVEPFDMVFIDADKEGYPEYLEWSLRLTRSGSLIVADNVVRGGAVLDASDPRAAGVRRYLERLAADERLEATVIQTVGVKGYDGLAIALVR